jgi:hypothetical protein
MIEYFPTRDMIADFFTQPAQVSAFQKFRNFIMNVDPAQTTVLDPRRVLVHEVPTDKKGDFVLPEKPENIWSVVRNRKQMKTDGEQYETPVSVINEKKCGMTGTNVCKGTDKGMWGIVCTCTDKGMRGVQRAHPHNTSKI